MLKNILLSTVAAASLCLSQSHAMTSDDMIGDNPTSSSSSSTSSNPTKLKPVVTESFLNGPNLNNSHKEDGTFDHDNNLLKEVFVQPLMDTLLHLASPCHRNPQGRYISHLDICNLIDAFYPLKSRFVRNMDWYKQVFYQPDVTDAYLTKEKLTREVYDHFWTESQAWFDALVHEVAASMQASGLETLPAASRVKLTQLATYRCLKSMPLQGLLDKRYMAYKRIVSLIKTSKSSSTELRISVRDKGIGNILSVLPPSSLWQRFSALAKLYLSSNQISELSPLKGLRTLTKLDLSDNRISDLTALKDLSVLRELILNRNRISDLSVLEGLSALRELDLRSNQISDISALKDLRELRNLVLSCNQISDISALKDLRELRDLSLNCNKISNLTALKDLRELRNLDLNQTEISDLSVLGGLSALQMLDIKLNHRLLSPLFLSGEKGEDHETFQARIAANHEVLRILRARGCTVYDIYDDD